jgi:hypothetical protein
LSGVPDLCIPVAKNGWHGLYIEMKKEKGTQSENQILIMEKLRNEGYACEVIYSFDEFREIVNKYFLL